METKPPDSVNVQPFLSFYPTYEEWKLSLKKLMFWNV